MLRFLVQVEGSPEREVEVSGDRAMAGADPSLPIALPGSSAARRHFEVEVREEFGVVLKHLASEGETRVNGALVSQVRLQVGDIVEVEGVRIVFATHTSDVDPAPIPVEAAPAPAPAGPPAAPAHRSAGPRPATARPRMPREPRRSSGAPTGILILVLLAVGVGAAYMILKKEEKPRRRLTANVDQNDPRPVPAPGPVNPVVVPPREDPAEVDFDPGPIVIETDQVPTPRTTEEEPEPVPVRVPDPVPEPVRPPPPDPQPDPLEAERREREKRLAEAEGKFAAFEEVLGERVSGYSFGGAIADLGSLVEPLPSGDLRARASGLLDDLQGAERVFGRFRDLLSSGSKLRIELAKGLTIVVTGADEEGFEGKSGPAVLRKKWSDVAPANLHGVMAKRVMEASDWLDLSAFAHLYGLPELPESDLIRAAKRDKDLKPDIDSAIARRRGVEVPAGGFVVHEDEWITLEEKGYIEKGLVRHDGKWMTPDEAKAAQGYVKHEGQWLSPEDYEDVLEAEREAAELAKKYLPKGLIDIPGNGDSVEWKNARDLKTPQYKIKSNLKPEVVKDIAYTMEILRTNLKRVFGLRGKGARFTVKVCASRDEYRKIWPRAGMSLGFCSSGEICTFYQPPMTTSVLMHEGTHEILRRFAPTCPRWLHEGIATYYECSLFEFDVKRRKVNLQVGLLNAQRLMSFRREQQMGRTVSLETFITGKGGNPYTQGWAFTYYLAKGKDGQYARRVHAFIKEAHKTDVVEQFQKIFRVKDLKKFEEEWLAFIAELDPAKGVTLAKQHR